MNRGRRSLDDADKMLSAASTNVGGRRATDLEVLLPSAIRFANGCCTERAFRTRRPETAPSSRFHSPGGIVISFSFDIEGNPSGSSRHHLRIRTWVTASNHRRITAPHTRTFNHGAALGPESDNGQLRQQEARSNPGVPAPAAGRRTCLSLRPLVARQLRCAPSPPPRHATAGASASTRPGSAPAPNPGVPTPAAGRRTCHLSRPLVARQLRCAPSPPPSTRHSPLPCGSGRQAVRFRAESKDNGRARA